ncbi:MAG: multidrug transporter [Rhodospirillales bacterium]|jgi:small multidrug resistance pump|nr:multidrug transporter [Rhodospirillales bacterium]MDB5382881.1 multidrug transporter [Rhodospirillales bacterium]
MILYWLALATAICTSLGGQVLLKYGASSSVAEGSGFFAQLFRLTTIVGLCLYGGSALLYIMALRRIPMSVALPTSAASYVVVALIGYFVFSEPITLQHAGAILLISVGVVLLATA